MSILNGEISFKPLVLLRVGNSVIESHDISASELHNFVVASEQTISRHVGAMYRRELQNARNPESKVPPVIHIVRLALYEYSPAVFNVRSPEKRGERPSHGRAASNDGAAAGKRRVHEEVLSSVSL